MGTAQGQQAVDFIKNLDRLALYVSTRVRRCYARQIDHAVVHNSITKNRRWFVADYAHSVLDQQLRMAAQKLGKRIWVSGLTIGASHTVAKVPIQPFE